MNQKHREMLISTLVPYAAGAQVCRGSASLYTLSRHHVLVPVIQVRDSQQHDDFFSRAYNITETAAVLHSFET